MKTLILKNHRTIYSVDGFFKMNIGDIIFIDEIWYKVKACSLMFPQNHLAIEVE